MLDSVRQIQIRYFHSCLFKIMLIYSWIIVQVIIEKSVSID